MKRLALAAIALSLSAPALAAKTEKRCGWLHNPTPANWWLDDRHGQWIMASQGGYQAPGMDKLPDMTTQGWVNTNGYGCACLSVRTDATSGRVLRIVAATPLPLRQCRADRRLPKPD